MARTKINVKQRDKKVLQLQHSFYRYKNSRAHTHTLLFVNERRIGKVITDTICKGILPIRAEFYSQVGYKNPNGKTFPLSYRAFVLREQIIKVKTIT